MTTRFPDLEAYIRAPDLELLQSRLTIELGVEAWQTLGQQISGHFSAGGESCRNRYSGSRLQKLLQRLDQTQCDTLAHRSRFCKVVSYPIALGGSVQSEWLDRK